MSIYLFVNSPFYIMVLITMSGCFFFLCVSDWLLIITYTYVMKCIWAVNMQIVCMLGILTYVFFTLTRLGFRNAALQVINDVKYIML